MTQKKVDLMIRGGRIFDGSGTKPFVGDIAIEGDTILELGTALPFEGVLEVDARGMDLTPGFINIHSWAAQDILADPRCLSDLTQGVTFEVFGEGWSEGPLNDAMKQYLQHTMGVPAIPWSSLGDFLTLLEQKGTAVNVGSLAGAATLRYHAMGLQNRVATPAERKEICRLLEETLRDGALGLGTALVYEPENLYTTDDLTEMAKVTAKYGGLYAAHVRSESAAILGALEEHVRITRESGVRSMVYHFKVQGKRNHHLQEAAIRLLEKARNEGLDMSACAYPYNAGSTGLSAVMNPAWKAEGNEQWLASLRDQKTRSQIMAEIRSKDCAWENFYQEAGGAEGILVTGMKTPAGAHLQGKRLTEIAGILNVSPEEAILDLILLNGADVQAIYFHTDEDNMGRVMDLPWVSVGSDSGSTAPDPGSTEMPHPRSYGSFTRFFNRFVFGNKSVSPEEAVRRVTSLPARQLNLDQERGSLKPGYAADIVVCKLEDMQDFADYINPRQLSRGVRDVIVNGKITLREGAYCGPPAGRFIKNRMARA